MTQGRGSSERLGRLLNLVPYLLARPGILVAEAAADLGVTEKQLREDLELLWVCGLPGYGPGDLIDMAYDGDRVTITYDAGIDRPLRLTQDEALALVVALRLLAQIPGVHSREAIERALAKIESAAGDAAAGLPVAVRPPGGNSARIAELQGAVQRRHALRMTYYTATRDELTDRVVDPLRVVLVGPHTYLEAWCRRAEAVRMFRADRIDSLEELDEPAAPPPDVRPSDVSTGVFTPSEDLPLVTLRIGRWARWITEYYPCERVVEETPERWLVSLRASDLSWAKRLVLGLGPGVTVLEPAELAEAVRDEARAALAAYEEDEPDRRQAAQAY
ncbi:MAG TPA: WYL domain-containing protein [Micromonosporaceae bacterium]|nr:WYL domain-containing protein [Micromonosporaceae bacterium]